MMKIRVEQFLAIVMIAGVLPFYGLASPFTVPAFLWSPHQDGLASNNAKEVVNYQTISQQHLASSIMSEGGWSNLLCSEVKSEQPLDLALVFVGRELGSLDILKRKHAAADPALVDLLKGSFTRSNFSMAFPYISTSDDEETMESSLISGFTKTCGHEMNADNIAFMQSCSIEGAIDKKLADLNSAHDFVTSRAARKSNGPADLLVFCHGDSTSIEKPDYSESEVLSDLISTLEQSGAKYAVLYVSDPFKLKQFPSYRDLDRFLAEGSYGNGSANSTTCDEVCQMKSSLLEATFVAIVLLIILISGLCCMMGIDTPTRFEAPQES